MHFYSFNIANYRKDTAHLMPLEHYIYRTLIDKYYLDERAITNDLQQICRQLLLNFDESSAIVDRILNEYFILDGDLWIHYKIELELEKYQNAQAGRNKGGDTNRKRWILLKKQQQHSKSIAKPIALPIGVDSLTKNYKLRTNKNTTVKNTVSKDKDLSKEQFDIFWKKYPKGREKPKALEMWMKKKPPIDQVLAALDWQIAEWELDDMRFVPYPAKYLKNEQWTDQPTSGSRKKPPSGTRREDSEFVGAL